MRHNFYGGKYTVEFDETTGKLSALRHGEPWRDLAGDGLVLAMLQRVDAQQKLLDRALFALSDARMYITGVAEDLSSDAVEQMLADFDKIEVDSMRLNKEQTDPTA